MNISTPPDSLQGFSDYVEGELRSYPWIRSLILGVVAPLLILAGAAGLYIFGLVVSGLFLYFLMRYIIAPVFFILLTALDWYLGFLPLSRRVSFFLFWGLLVVALWLIGSAERRRH